VEEMNTGYETQPSLQAVFEGAKTFGLTEDEVWRMFNRCLDEAGHDATVSEYLDELAGALASLILAKERRARGRHG
jgi:hypothetical protein